MDGIKNWTENTPYNFIRAGVIRLGEKTDKGAPKKLDHFVVPDEVAKVYDDKPKSLDIVLPDEHEFLSASLKRYDGNNNLICHGNGKKASVSINRLKYKPNEYYAKIEGDSVYINDKQVEVTGNTDNHKWAHFNCPYQQCPHYKESRCKETVILYFCLTKIPASVLQVYSITTRSYNSYHHLMIGARELRNRFGRASFVPVQLKVKMEEKQVPGKQFKNEVPILYLDFEESYEKIWEKALQGKMIWSFNPVNNEPVPEAPKQEDKEIINKNLDTTKETNNNTQQDENLLDSAMKNLGDGTANENSNNQDDDEKTEFTILKQPELGEAKGQQVAKADIAINATKEIATLWARGHFIKTMLLYQKDENYTANIVPIQVRESEYILKEEPPAEEQTA